MKPPTRKPFSEACERNRLPIAEVLSPTLTVGRKNVLEIGSGTGQHAVFLARRFPECFWQTSDLPQHHPGIAAWLSDSGLSNIGEPVAMDVREPIPGNLVGRYDVVFTANTLHFMAVSAGLSLLDMAWAALKDGGCLWVYGPFNRNGDFTSEGNARLDAWLKLGDPERGIRDLQWLKDNAARTGLELVQERNMPANNLMLQFSKRDIAHPQPV